MLVWPAELPQGFPVETQDEPQDTRLRSEMDAGPAKMRPRFTAGVTTYRFALVMTAAQLAVLKVFYKTTTKQGTETFTWADPWLDAGVRTLRFAEPFSSQGRSAGPPVYTVGLVLEELP